MSKYNAPYHYTGPVYAVSSTAVAYVDMGKDGKYYLWEDYTDISATSPPVRFRGPYDHRDYAQHVLDGMADQRGWRYDSDRSVPA